MKRKGEIEVCLGCYGAVIKLCRGISESILKSKCEYCGRIFILEKEKEILFINESQEVSEEAWKRLGTYKRKGGIINGRRQSK